MGVNHRGFDIFVAEKFLNGADRLAIFQQMRCVAVTECVRGNVFVNMGGDPCGLDRFLDHRFVDIRLIYRQYSWFYPLRITVESGG